MKPSFAEEMALALCRPTRLTSAQPYSFDNQRLARTLVIAPVHRYRAYPERTSASALWACQFRKPATVTTFSDALVAPRKLAWPLSGTLTEIRAN